MSLPIAIGSKLVSSRSLLSSPTRPPWDPHDINNDHDDEPEEQQHFYADDGITLLDQVPMPGAPLTALATCPQQDWLATVTIRYFDMMMVRDDDSEDNDGNADNGDAERPQGWVAVGDHQHKAPVNPEDEDNGVVVVQQQRRRCLVKHSTVAELRVHISPLSLPYSSAYRDVVHRLTLPNMSLPFQRGKSHHAHHHHHAHDNHHHLNNPQKHTSAPFLTEDHIHHHLAKVQPSLVFSSDRRSLACLVPLPRGPNSVLVAIPLKRPTQNPYKPPPIPTLPDYIHVNTKRHGNKRRSLPEASGELQCLRLPERPGLDIRDHSLYLLYNITAIVNASTELYQHQYGASSVLLAGCRDGTLLGISFRPLLLAGQLYHPTVTVDGAVTCLSHVVLPSMAPAAAVEATTTTAKGESPKQGEAAVFGRLVMVRETGNTMIFQTRMVLSSLRDDDDDDDDDNDGDYYDVSEHFHRESSFSHHLDTSEYGTADVAPVVIHGENFHVVNSGRRHSLPANTRIAHGGVKHLDGIWDTPHHNDNELRPNSGVGESSSLITPRKLAEYFSSPVRTTGKLENDGRSGNTGLLMLIDPMTEYHPEDSHICYAMWITGELLAVLQKPAAVLPNSQSKSSSHQKRTVAQVLAVFPDRPPEPLSEMVVSAEGLLENAHTTFHLGDDQEESNMHGENQSLAVPPLTDTSPAAMSSILGMEYDQFSGCLAVSSIRLSEAKSHSEESIAKKNFVVARCFVCLWHWRSNVTGFTAIAKPKTGSALSRQQSMSRLLFAKERGSNKRHLVHVMTATRQGDPRFRKDIYQAGLLSPPHEVQNGRGWAPRQASPLLLTASSVAFPVMHEPSSDSTREIQWQESTVPQAYIEHCGAPLVAAVGSTGRSVAVASSRSVCVLECSQATKAGVNNDRRYASRARNLRKFDSHSVKTTVRHTISHKWHFFGNETEERAFRVLAMAWWESCSNSSIKIDRPSDNHITDDLLVALIQLREDDVNSQCPAGTCFLASWSQRRLDCAHQRLRPFKRDSRECDCHWGVRLDDNFRPTTLSLLAQPESVLDQSSSGVAEHQHQRRAVVLLSSIVSKTATDSAKFELYQLQVIPGNWDHRPGSYVEQNPYSITSRQCSKGAFGRSIGGSSISTIFLASASFQFDLRTTSAEKEKKTIPVLATVGVLQSPGGGVDAVAVTASGTSSVVPVVTHDSNDSNSKAMSTEVSSYWLADFVPARRHGATNGGELLEIDFYVWNLQLADGKMLSWFVPCLVFLASSTQMFRLSSSRIMLGMVCPMGNSSTWLQRSPAKTSKEFVVGGVPNFSYGCVLCTGQGTRKYHRPIAGDFAFASDFMEHEFLCPGDFVLTPPVYISSIFAIVNSAASLLLSRGPDTNPGNSQKNGGNDITNALLCIDPSFHLRFRANPYQDAAFMALRLLVLRSAEQLAEQTKSKPKKNEQASALAAAVLNEVVHAARNCTTGRLEFASLLLEVGRQMEPSCFPCLFPLPTPLGRSISTEEDKTTDMESTAPSNGSKTALALRTVEELFLACKTDGALLTSVSALPILRCNMLEACVSVFDHCLNSFQANTKSENFLSFDFSSEERLAMSDLFRFAMKLEDNGGENPAIVGGKSGEKAVEYYYDDDEARVGTNGKGYSLTCGIFSRSWFGGNQSLPTQKNPNETQSVDQLPSAKALSYSCSRTVAHTFVEILFLEGAKSPLRWKKAAALANCLLGQNSALLPRISASGAMNIAAQIDRISGKRDNSTIASIENRLSILLKISISDCTVQIGVRSAGRILDLMLILFSKCSESKVHLDKELPGLLVGAITTAHVSNRVEDILDISDPSNSFVRSYLKANDIRSS